MRRRVPAQVLDKRSRHWRRRNRLRLRLTSDGITWVETRLPVNASDVERAFAVSAGENTSPHHITYARTIFKREPKPFFPAFFPDENASEFTSSKENFRPDERKPEFGTLSVWFSPS
ncbi:hypothetical protein Trydic_g11243 [Trypoxylus dichotomus]